MGQDEPEVRHNVDLLVEKIVDALDEEAGPDVQEPSGSENLSTTGSIDGVNGKEGRRNVEAHRPSSDCVEDQPLLREVSPGGCRASMNDDSSHMPETPASPSTLAIAGKDCTEASNRSCFSRASSCPPSEDRQAFHGPWNWEWGGGVSSFLPVRGRSMATTLGVTRRGWDTTLVEKPAGSFVIRFSI
jgi:hypothetical protein